MEEPDDQEGKNSSGELDDLQMLDGQEEVNISEEVDGSLDSLAEDFDLEYEVNFMSKMLLNNNQN